MITNSRNKRAMAERRVIAAVRRWSLEYEQYSFPREWGRRGDIRLADAYAALREVKQ